MTFLVPKSPIPVNSKSHTTVEEVEAVLAEWFSAPVVLTSSGRSALLLILQELGFDRYTHRLALPRLISRCVLDAVVHNAFPIDVADSATADATLLYHQYGFMQTTWPSGVVIEDIAHAFFSVPGKDTPRDLAIFSLPKFFSTTTMVGGAIASNEPMAQRLRERRDAAPAKPAATPQKEAELFRTLTAAPGLELELLYTARLVNPRIYDAELGGLPATLEELKEIRSKRQETFESLLKAAGNLIPTGWADMLRANLPYALPVVASQEVLESVNRDLRDVGVESDVYTIDTARNMRSPHHERMLLVPYSHTVPHEALQDIKTVLSRYGNKIFKRLS